MRTAMFTTMGVLAAAVALTVASVAARAEDKPLTIGINADPDVLDMTISVNPPQGLATLTNVYEGIWAFNPDGTSGRASSKTTRLREDGKLITLHFRHGVKFQSGDPFTAQDLLWSHDRMLKKTWFYQRLRALRRPHGGARRLHREGRLQAGRFAVPRDPRDLIVPPRPTMSASARTSSRSTRSASAPTRSRLCAGQYIDLEALDGY